MSALTKRQREVLDFIEAFIKANRYSPTFEQISVGMEFKSLATVHKHVHNLKDKGFLRTGTNKARSIEVTVPDALSARFRLEGNGRLWDNLANCYWIRE